MPSGQLRLCENSLIGPGPWPDEELRFSPANGRIKLALRLIKEQHRDSELSLGKLSKQVRLSVGYLSRLFKKETGVSFRQYLREVRLRKAEELLRDPILSIKEVAMDVGYRHVSDFDHHFKSAYGIRPTAYRQASGKLEPELKRKKSP
jgi:two-component system response regulator YesN